MCCLVVCRCFGGFSGSRLLDLLRRRAFSMRIVRRAHSLGPRYRFYCCMASLRRVLGIGSKEYRLLYARKLSCLITPWQCPSRQFLCFFRQIKINSLFLCLGEALSLGAGTLDLNRSAKKFPRFLARRMALFGTLSACSGLLFRSIPSLCATGFLRRMSRSILLCSCCRGMREFLLRLESLLGRLSLAGSLGLFSLHIVGYQLPNNYLSS